MEYYSATGKDETMPSAVTWMGLAMIMLNRIKSDRETHEYSTSLVESEI